MPDIKGGVIVYFQFVKSIMLILTCAIQMINVIAIEPGIRDQKYFCHCLCLSPLSEKSV